MDEADDVLELSLDQPRSAKTPPFMNVRTFTSPQSSHSDVAASEDEEVQRRDSLEARLASLEQKQEETNRQLQELKSTGRKHSVSCSKHRKLHCLKKYIKKLKAKNRTLVEANKTLVNDLEACRQQIELAAKPESPESPDEASSEPTTYPKQKRRSHNRDDDIEIVDLTNAPDLRFPSSRFTFQGK